VAVTNIPSSWAVAWAVIKTWGDESDKGNGEITNRDRWMFISDSIGRINCSLNFIVSVYSLSYRKLFGWRFDAVSSMKLDEGLI
jgi:hypothetical protein